jgi:hypothetical protein
VSYEAARAHWEPGMTGADVIRQTVGEACPKCGSILDRGPAQDHGGPICVVRMLPRSAPHMDL